jgi:hypothetical protein
MKMEKRSLEHCCPVKFCVKLSENATDTTNLNRLMERAQVFRWHKAFLDGRECGRMNLVLEDLACQKWMKI